jgi:hypothetical protein
LNALLADGVEYEKYVCDAFSVSDLEEKQTIMLVIFGAPFVIK